MDFGESERLVSVAVGRPMPAPFTYAVPRGMEGALERGRRLVVPFGKSSVVGFSLGPAEGPAPKGLKGVGKVLDDGPLFDGELLDLLLWASRYYRHAPGEVLRSALPPSLSGCLPAQKLRSNGRLMQEWVRLTDQGRQASLKGARQKAVRDYLAGSGRPKMTMDELLAALPGSRAVISNMAAKGFCHLWSEDRARPEVDRNLAGAAPVSPTEEQAATLRELEKALEDKAFAPFLLHGVTGSGKTEVYMRTIERALALGRGALVLVPEISLTPQLLGRFRVRFGDKVALLHSGLNDGERQAEWMRLKEGRSHLAVGVRSAIFAPVQNLGLIVVDEEHDGSFKQDEGFCYSARDLAVVRAQRLGCPVVLGSATPSLESLWNARRGRYRLLTLAHRVDDRPMPSVALVDLRESKGHIAAAFPQLAGKMRMMAQESQRLACEAAEEEVGYDAARGAFSQASGGGAFHPVRPRPVDNRPLAQAPLLSPELSKAIGETLDMGRQTILFLNRRGTTTFHMCMDCGQSIKCPDCAVSMTLHQFRNELLCHYCGRTIPLPEACPACHGRIERLGMGTEQVEAELANLFPHARIERLDRDSADSPEAITQRLSAFARGDKDILIGTQMVAKGHDFPGVLLVGVLLADLALNLPDFRAAERTFQLIAQVAGRAGRGTEPGRVIVQTFSPQAPAIAHVIGHDFNAFADGELKLRQMGFFPPFARLAQCRLDGRDPRAVAQAAEHLAAVASAAIRNGRLPVRLQGPSPAPLSRLKGRDRWQLLVKGPTPASLTAVTDAILKAAADLKGDLRVSLDIDPQTML